jgi:flagellar motor protein MotB
MFTRIPPRNEEEQKDIFAPVADLMVGVVFIFIILILALSLNLATEQTVPRSTYDRVVEENASLRQQLAASRADVSRLVEVVRFVRDSQVAPLLQRLSKADQTRTAILADMQSRLAALNVEVKVNPDAGTLSLPSSKLFDSGQADPTVPTGRDTILRLGQVMADVLPCYAPTMAGGADPSACPASGDFSNVSAAYIEGHTDVFPYGSVTGRFRNNWDLSAGRAIEAFTLIRDHYEKLRALKNGDGDAILGVSGYADTRPLDRSATDRQAPAAAERDRRIEVRIMMSTNQEFVSAVLNELNQRLRSVDELVR